MVLLSKKLKLFATRITRTAFTFMQSQMIATQTKLSNTYDFIKKLIQHIPEKHFKMVRYYGIYARHHDSDKNLQRAIAPHKRNFFRSLNSWRNYIFPLLDTI